MLIVHGRDTKVQKIIGRQQVGLEAMGDGVYQLTFIVSVRDDAPVLTPVQGLNRAIDRAREFDILRVSGVVLQRSKRLLWCMEGSEAVIADQYERVKALPEVEGVTILRQRHAQSGTFSRWAFAIEDDPRDNQPPVLVDRLVTLLANAPQEIRQTFLAFAKLDAPRRLH